MRTPLDLILSGDVAGLIISVGGGGVVDGVETGQWRKTEKKNNDDDVARAQYNMSDNTSYYVSSSSSV